jgi:hypothetical protein
MNKNELFCRLNKIYCRVKNSILSQGGTISGKGVVSFPDTSIEVNGVAEGSVVAGSTVDIQLVNTTPVAVAPLSVTQVGNDFVTELDDVTYDIYVNGVFNTTVILPYGENNTLNINA